MYSGSGQWTSLVLVWILGILDTVSSSTMPNMSCPVGATLDTAFYFKTISDETLSLADRYAQFLAEDAATRRATIMSEIGESDTLSDKELIDRASLYYGVLKAGGTPENYEANKFILASALDPSVLSDLRWSLGLLSTQDLVLAACEADYSTVKCKYH